MKLSSKPGWVFRVALANGVVLLAGLGAIASGWEKKDWSQWSLEDCTTILSNSPWATTKGSSSPEGFASVAVQFASALPIRQALVRSRQFWAQSYKHDAKRIQAYLQQDQTCFSQTYPDRIVVHVMAVAGEYPSRRDPTYVGFISVHSDGALTLPNGKKILAIQSTPTPPTDCLAQQWRPAALQERREWDLAFPRTVDGEPAIKPGDKKVTVILGTLVHKKNGEEEFDIDASFDFDVTKMIYKGKLEY